MNWFVYIVRCGDNSLYTGITTDVSRRVRQHNGEIKNGALYTRAKRPVTLVYTQRVRSRSMAMKREAAIKKLPRVKKLQLFT